MSCPRGVKWSTEALRYGGAEHAACYLRIESAAAAAMCSTASMKLLDVADGVLQQVAGTLRRLADEVERVGSS